jgi:hypothetical protein
MIVPASTVSRSVFFEGPCSDQDGQGDEVPVWFVFIGDTDGDPVDKVSQFTEFDNARGYARDLAAAWQLSLVSDAMPN